MTKKPRAMLFNSFLLANHYVHAFCQCILEACWMAALCTVKMGWQWLDGSMGTVGWGRQYRDGSPGMVAQGWQHWDCSLGMEELGRQRWDCSMEMLVWGCQQHDASTGSWNSIYCGEVMALLTFLGIQTKLNFKTFSCCCCRTAASGLRHHQDGGMGMATSG